MQAIKGRIAIIQSLALIVCCTVVVLVTRAPVYADVKSGVEKYQAGNYAGAIEEWLPAAADNDPYALFFMGQVYRLGRGVEPDLRRAEYYYDRAARLGHVSAQGNIATLYYFAEPPRRKIQEAIQWWRIAAANGDPRSQYMLGVLNFNGADMEKNWDRAYAWMLLARVGGIDEAQKAIDQMERHLTDGQRMEGAKLSTTLFNPISEEDLLARAPSPPSVKMPQELQVAMKMKPSKKDEAERVEKDTASVQPELETTTSDNAKAPFVDEREEVAMKSVEDNWRVQIAAYDRLETAQAAWAGLKRRYGDILGRLVNYIVDVDLGEKGRFFRLQVGPFAVREEANTLCASLKEQGLSCLAVKSPG